MDGAEVLLGRRGRQGLRGHQGERKALQPAQVDAQDFTIGTLDLKFHLAGKQQIPG